MKPFFAEILANREKAENVFELLFRWPENLRRPHPGQFLMIQTPEPHVTYLRRPFALASFDSELKTAGLLYTRQGAFTSRLAGLAPGQGLDLLGPRGFFFRTEIGKTPLLLAGGHGVGPLVFAANDAAVKGYKPVFIADERSAAAIRQLWFHPSVRLELSKPPLERLDTLSEAETLDCVLWVGGPPDLLRSGRDWAKKRRLSCQVLVEEVFGCGVGACQGCAVETADGGKARVCTEGPVFASEALKWS